MSSAVSQATPGLNGTSRFGDIFGDGSGFDQDIAKIIEEEVYTVEAAGADGAFCVHVVRTRSKEGDYEPPGVAGGPGSMTVPSHDFSVTSREGAC